MQDREDGLTAVEVADAFSRTAKTLARWFDERLGEHGVSTPRSRVVVEVMRAQPVRVSDLAMAVGIAQGTASGLVDALVRDGLLQRDVDPVDRRAVRLNVTPSGEALAREWLVGYRAAAEDLFAALPRDQWPAFVEMLRHLT